jgi:hypothetical protein
MRSTVRREFAESAEAAVERLDHSEVLGEPVRTHEAVRSVIDGLKQFAQFLGPPPPKLVTVQVRLEPPPATRPAAPAP